jgi:hypothetical protein
MNTDRENTLPFFGAMGALLSLNGLVQISNLLPFFAGTLILFPKLNYMRSGL